MSEFTARVPGRDRLRVSVVIPVRNEEGTIGALLSSLLAQTRLPDEVVITDGGSTDRTVALIEEFAKAHPVKLVRALRAYPGEGRNLGVLAASHDVVAFTDAGVTLDARWLEKLCEPMELDPSVDVMYGTYEPILDTFFKECAALAYVPAPVERDGSWIRGPSVVSTAMKKTVWSATGGFPPYRAAEDLIFMDTVAKGNFTMAYAPEAVVYWEIPGSWGGTFRRFVTYSRHNLIAGWGRHWHMGVARLYAVGLIFVIVGFLHSAWWVIALPAGLGARVLRTAARKRHAFAFRDVYRLPRLLYLAGLLLVLDLATAWGALVWAVRDRLLAGWGAGLGLARRE
jgi:cellulose synthase/poly-beta-1,6-N-acetylglucosamine synthase-like glycosyltransferase